MLGAMVITSSQTGISESSGASIGAMGRSCNDLDRVTIMTSADALLAAKSVGTNMTFIIDGSLHLASGGSGQSNHYGVAIHTAGTVDITTHHNYFSCGTQGNDYSPTMSVIRNINAN